MNYRDIVKKYDVILSVSVKGRVVKVNGDVYAYKYPAVAKAVAQKVEYFLGVK